MPRVNLVPREEQAREFRRRIYIFPVAGAVLLVAAMGGSYYYYSTQQSNLQAELDSTRQANSGFSGQIAELNQYDQLKTQKQNRLAAVSTLYNSRVRWSRVMDDVSFVIPDDCWLTNVTASVPGASAGTSAGTAGRAGGASSSSGQDITFEGYTNQNSMPSVAIFMVRLGLLSSLQNVQLISAETEKLGNSLTIHFKIAASLRQTADSSSRPSTAPTTGETGPSQVTTATGSQTSTSPTTTAPRTTTGTSTGASTGASTTGGSGGPVG